MNLYQTCYDLICQFVFNNEGVVDGVLVDQMQHLTATLFSTAAWLFCVIIPFWIVIKLVGFIGGGCWNGRW